ncbi:MAG TPA: hypothetical protein VKA48_13015 [Gammaproteobacteria bacterium]|nr:hypothetical protein [Gammaproteobacteria bacterium]
MGDKGEEALLRRIMESSDISKSKAIAIAKSRGWIKQNGKHLELTAKGKQHARKAMQHNKG